MKHAAAGDPPLVTKLDYEPQQPQSRPAVRRWVVLVVTTFVVTWIVVMIIAVAMGRIDPAIGICGAVIAGALLWFVLNRARQAR